MEMFYNLSFSKQPDGAIRLVQSDCGDDHIIDLHPEQVLFMARRICGMKPETANRVEELERRISVLTDKLQHLVCGRAFRSDLIDGSVDGFAHLDRLDALLDLAMEFDGGRLEPECAPESASSSNASQSPFDITKTQKKPLSVTAERMDEVMQVALAFKA